MRLAADEQVRGRSRRSYFASSHSARTTGYRRHTRSRDLDKTDRAHQFYELIDLVAPARQLEYEAFGRGVDYARAKGVREAKRLDPALALAAHLHHSELTLDRLAFQGQIRDFMDGHQPF